MHQGKDLLCDYQVNSGRSSSAQWPGYEHLNWSFSTPASSSMTLVQFGASIFGDLSKLVISPVRPIPLTLFLESYVIYDHVQLVEDWQTDYLCSRN